MEAGVSGDGLHPADSVCEIRVVEVVCGDVKERALKTVASDTRHYERLGVNCS